MEEKKEFFGNIEILNNSQSEFDDNNDNINSYNNKNINYNDNNNDNNNFIDDGNINFNDKEKEVIVIEDVFNDKIEENEEKTK